MKLINYIRIVFKKEQMKGFRSEFNPTKLANLLPLFFPSPEVFIILLQRHVRNDVLSSEFLRR